MKITFLGTRGSLPVSSPQSVSVGGNTTCLRIESSALPPHHALIVDAGSGIRAVQQAIYEEKITEVALLFTHYHYDHIQGLLLWGPLYDPQIQIAMYGPLEHDIGPIQMLQQCMRPPFHPVDYHQVAAHLSSKSIAHPAGQVLLFHPEGGRKLMTIDEFIRAENRAPHHCKFGRASYPINECLVVKMYRTYHPERTISYRFEERSTGKVFVFLTDHENIDGLPLDLYVHLYGADLLVMDCQYFQLEYQNRTSGFGHATPDYCARVASHVGAKSLGVTHHDPNHSDEDIELMEMDVRLEAERQNHEAPKEIFACRDHQVVEL